MLDSLKKAVCQANLALREYNLAPFTWGNVSGIDISEGLVVIKPSGVAYDALQPEDMVVVRLSDGTPVEGKYKPSTDTETHLELYRSFKGIGGVAHTHSLYATAFAQARLTIPCYGTTHADYFFGSIPCTRELSDQEIDGAYEKETGCVIAETFCGTDPLKMPGVLVAGHGPFTWGETAVQAALNAAYLEEVARLAWMTSLLAQQGVCISQHLLERHFFRKHGSTAYYGQDKEDKE